MSEAKAKVGMDRDALMNKLRKSKGSMEPAGGSGGVDRKTLLRAVQLGSKKSAGLASPSPSSRSLGGEQGLNLEELASPPGGLDGSAASKEDWKRLAKRLQQDIQTKVTEVHNARAETQRKEQELDSLRTEIELERRKHLAELERVQKDFPRLVQDHPKNVSRMQESSHEAGQMREAILELKRQLDLHLQTKIDYEQMEKNMQEAKAEASSLEIKLEEERTGHELAGLRLGFDLVGEPMKDEEYSEHFPWSSEEIESKVRAVDESLSSLSNFHELYLSELHDTQDFQSPFDETATSRLPEHLVSLQQSSVELQRNLVIVACRHLGLLSPGDSKRIVHQNVALRRKLDDARATCSKLQVENELLQRKLRSSAPNVETQTLKGDFAAVQSELAHMKITSSAEVSRLELANASLQKDLLGKQDELQLLRREVEKMRRGISSSYAENAGPESSADGSMRQQLEAMERRCRVILDGVGQASRGTSSATELRQANDALRAEMGALRKLLHLPSSRHPGNASATSLPPPPPAQEDVNIVDLLRARLAGFFAKHDTELLEHIQTFRASSSDIPHDQCQQLVSSLTKILGTKPEYEVRALTARHLLEASSLEDKLSGLEEYFYDFGFFIGWEKGQNLQDGAVLDHLLFR